MEWNISGTIRPDGDGGYEVDLVAAKKAASRKQSPALGATTDEELMAELQQLAGELGPALASTAAQMRDLLASGNKSGKVSARRVINEIYAPLARAREKSSEEALLFGMEQAILKSIPNVNYAKKAAQSYEPTAGPGPTTPTTRYDILGGRT